MWVEFELDSLIPGWMWRDLSTQEFSPLLILSCHHPHPSPHPPLDLLLVPNRGRERGWEGRDALEVKRSMWSSLPGQNRSVGWVTSRSDDVVIVADTVTRE